MLPIVQRELRVGARDPKLYRGRIRFGFLVLLVCAFVIVIERPGGRSPGGVFWFITWLSLLFCLLEGVRKTADSISEERREGTLGFLFLTELRGFDVVLGKFAGAFIRSFSGLLAFIPILAVTLLLGGTTAGEFWRSVLVLTLAMTISLSVCLAISSVRKEGSTGNSIAILFLLGIAPPALGQILAALGVISDTRPFHAASPLFVLNVARDASYSVSPLSFWIGVAAQCGIVLSALSLASLITPRIWKDKTRPQKVRPRTSSDQKSRARRARFLDKNPFLWLTYHERQHRLFTIVFMSIAAIFLVASVIVLLTDAFGGEAAVFPSVAVFVLSLLVAIHLASQSSFNLAEAKRNGAMELVLSTPMKVRDIIDGQWLALKRMFLPAALVIGSFAGVIWLTMVLQFSPGQLLIAAKMTVEVILEFYVIGWVGMWSGLVSKTPNAAFFRTILVGILLPYLFCTPTLLNQVILIAVASKKVRYQFRRFIAEKYLQDPKFVLTIPSPQPAAPPVIR